MMNISINKSQTQTLANAIEIFEDFVINEISADDYNSMSETEKSIDDIDDVLDEIYQDLEVCSALDLSSQQICCLLSALSVYKSVVENDVKTSHCLHRSKSEKDLALRNISEIQQYLYELLNELDPTSVVSEFEITPDTDWS